MPISNVLFNSFAMFNVPMEEKTFYLNFQTPFRSWGKYCNELWVFLLEIKAGFVMQTG